MPNVDTAEDVAIANLARHARAAVQAAEREWERAMVARVKAELAAVRAAEHAHMIAAVKAMVTAAEYERDSRDTRPAAPGATGFTLIERRAKPRQKDAK
jgi:hypothetical protein